MTTGKRLTITEARAVLLRHGIDRTAQSVINWCRKHGIGVQLGSPHGLWMVYEDKLMEFIGEGAHKDGSDG